MKRQVSLLVLLIGLAAIAGTVAWFLLREKPAPAAAPAHPFVIPVTLSPVVQRDVVPEVRLTGTVRSASTASVAFQVGGTVKVVHVEEGAEVAENQELATLDDADQRVRETLAQAGVTWAKARLDVLLAGARTEMRRRLAARVEAAEAEVEFATKEVERSRGLRQRDVMSERDFDSLVAARNAAVARRDAAAQELAESEAGTREEELQVQRAEVAMKEAEAAVAVRETQKTVLRAPFRGHVVRRHVSAGDRVDPSRPAFDLVDLDRREIVLDVASRHAAQLADKPRLEVTIDENPEFRLVTDVDAVVVAAAEPSRRFRAIARLDSGEDAPRALKPGMFGRAVLSLRPVAGATVVPADAVRTTPQGPVVVRAAPSPAPPGPHGPGLVAELVPVRLLGSDAKGTAVQALAAPLKAGDQVVVVGGDLAFPGASLMPAQPPAGAGGPGAAATAPAEKAEGAR
jgi:RND family efflux transporter MFP subunit